MQRAAYAWQLAMAIFGAGFPGLALADPCQPLVAVNRVCVLPQPVIEPKRVRPPAPDEFHSAHARLGGHWYVGRDDQRDFGLVRQGDRSELSLTKDGLRVTLRF